MRDLDLFEKAVGQFFEPIAQRLKLPLFKIEDGIYEIPSPFFIMRIRLHTGHSSRGMNVIIRKTSLCDFEDNKPGAELGIECFRLFKGEELEASHMQVLSNADFISQAEWFAKEAELLGIPYLLGLKDDFETVQEFIAERSESEVQRIREMTQDILRKMPNVRAEWPVVIPREKGAEGETAKELRESDIEFLGELEGQKERIFKEKLVELFKCDRSIKSAYLARIVGYGIPATAALCLRTRTSSDKNMTEQMGKIFAAVFGIDENFNVIFLTEQQEPLIAKVCRPFFDEVLRIFLAS